MRNTEKLMALISAKQDCGQVYDAANRGIVWNRWLANYLADNDVIVLNHGSWKKWNPPKCVVLTGEVQLYMCTVCESKWSNVDRFKYCPYCGARMDREGQDND